MQRWLNHGTHIKAQYTQAKAGKAEAKGISAVLTQRIKACA